MLGEVFPDPRFKIEAKPGCGEFDGDTLNLISDFLITILSPLGELPAGLLIWSPIVGLLFLANLVSGNWFSAASDDSKFSSR